MAGIFDPLIFDALIFDTGAMPIEPPIDWAPALNLQGSSIIAQALRFMRLAPVARHDPGSELLPALQDAFDITADDLLASADWSFASTVALLPPAALPPVQVIEADLPACAMLPGDLIALRQIWPVGTRWRIDGRILRHDAPGAVTIRYTARVTRETALPAAVRTALSLQIALRLAGRWAGSGADPEALENAARLDLKQAMRDDSRQASAAPWAEAEGGLIYGGEGDWALEATA